MKIVHISDLHFGRHQDAIVDCFLKDLSSLNPDLILISGDLTHRATSGQYQQLQYFLKQLKAVVLMVPGNHDIPLYNLVERFFSPFAKYKRYVQPNLTVRYGNELIRILGVNSVDPYRVKNGRLSAATMEAIEDYFSPAFNGLNLLFLHHNFDYREGLHKPLRNYAALLAYLKKSAVHLVCNGHVHYANICLLEKQNQRACLMLHAGSLLSERTKDGCNSYYILEADHQRCQISWRVLKNAAFHTLKQYDFDRSKNFVSLATP
ncbi:MAG: metallophosphoesterase [Legionellaceae bacterium]|nr:metallophosphoesterase [Legionellaceae bacterium]